MSSNWQLHAIYTTPRPLVDVHGRPLLNGPTGTQVGTAVSGVLEHWMDAPQYGGWVPYARAQWSHAAANQDPVALQNAAKAVMAAYNAANIPWPIDPIARALHQEMIAGPPATVGSGLAEFSGSRPYNASVMLGPDPGRCIVVPGIASGDTYGGCNSDEAVAGGVQTSAFTGALPHLARARYSAFPYPGGLPGNPVQYLPRLQFILRVPDTQSMLGVQYRPGSDPHTPFPFDPGLVTADVIYNDVIWRTEPKQVYLYNDGSDASSDPDGWDVCAFDRGSAGAPEQFRLGWTDYVTYLDGWIGALESRTIYQLVQDARAYAIYRNTKSWTIEGGTGLSSLAGGIAGNLTALQTPNAALGGDLRIAAAAAAATGAALAPATFGISALIAGAVSATLLLSVSAVPPDLTHIYIDDLERPKPWIERSWLGGSPSLVTQSDGPPALDIPDPPGWTRPVMYTNLAIGRPVTASQFMAGSPLPVTPPPPGSWAAAMALLASVPEPVWLGAGLVIGSAALYAGYRLTQGTSRPRRSSSRRSRSR